MLLPKKRGVIDGESVDEVLPLLAMRVLFQNIQVLAYLAHARVLTAHTQRAGHHIFFVGT